MVWGGIVHARYDITSPFKVQVLKRPNFGAAGRLGEARGGSSDDFTKAGGGSDDRCEAS